MINTEVINECINKDLSFPEQVKRLSEIGIERYYTDLFRMEKIFYTHNGESYIKRIPIENMPKTADGFNETKVIEVLRLIQKEEINYSAFIRGIVAAGTVSYTVYIDGRQVIYVGRKGEAYIEKFPFVQM
jgi:uncharacterized protein YbcV (DUF1398 family)